MNKVKLWIRQIIKNKGYYIFLTAEVVIVLLILVSMIGKLQAMYATNEIGNAVVDKNVYAFSEYDYYRENTTEVDKCLDKYHVINLPTCFLGMTLNGEEISMLGYSEKLFDVYSPKLEDGEWIDSTKEYEYIPVIVSGDKYQVGECFETKDPQLTFQVVGIISPEEYVLLTGVGGTTGYASLSEVFYKISSDFIVPCDCEHLKCVWKEQIDARAEWSGRLILLPDELANREEEIVKEINQYGYITNVKKMSENYNASNREFCIVNGIVLFVFSMITLAGVGGINNMVEIKNEKRMTIYYMYGFTKRKCMLYTYLSAIIPLILGEFIFIFWYYHGLDETYTVDLLEINIFTFVAAAVYLVILFHITIIPEMIRLGKKDLFALYKQKV